MINILVIEDDTVKLQRIVQAISGVNNYQQSWVDDARDIYHAKIKLKSNKYDLLVLDINVPPTIGAVPLEGAGLHLLNELFINSEFSVPSHIIGITSFVSVFKQLNSTFSRRSLTLLKYDATDNSWIDPLQERVRHILAALASLDVADDYKSDLAIVCALSDPELAHIRKLDWGWKQLNIRGDDTIYYSGVYRRGDEVRSVHAAACSHMGMPSASILSSKMIHRFRPRFIGMPGISAGVAGRCKFGDALVPKSVWDWGSGKWVVKGSGEDKQINFEPAPYHISLDGELRKKFVLFDEQKHVLHEIKDAWPGEPPEHPLSIHMGPLASGASVLADGMTIERIREQNRNLLGIEMEVYGVFLAADEASLPRPSAFAIKSVVDFADGEKNDQYRKYAAYTSAQILGRFAENHL